jgi:carbon monoxide dehydrogenase subunit G
MEIQNSFIVDAPISEAWELLTNIAEIAPCLPGAKLTDETDGVYSGGVKVKVGPVTAEYKGSAEFVEKDDANYKAVISGKGRDTRGAGNAQALITAQMTAVGDKTEVDIVTDLKVSGKVAQFGRGVMQDVSTKLLGQFAECLESKIGEPDTIDEVAAAGAAAVETPVDGDAPSTHTPVQSVQPVASAEEESVLDLGDVGIGGVLLKRYGAAAGATALLLVLLMWMARRLRTY